MTKRNGYQRVILQVSDEDFAFAEAKAKDQGYFGPADYLNGLLKSAILEERDREPLHLPAPDDDEETVLVEDDGGGMRLAGDIEDDIPF